MSPITQVQGDIFLTRAQAIAVGINANGRLGVTPFYAALHDRHPVFVSACLKRARADALHPGGLWVWQDSQPWLVALVVRETPQGATRLRYVEAAMLNLLKEWERAGLRSLAIPPIGTADEWPAVREIVAHYGAQMALPITLYTAYLPGVAAEDDPVDKQD